MSDIPACPEYLMENTNPDGENNYICADCVYDWLMHEEEGEAVVKDSNGNELHDGDSVVLIGDLKVKGTSITLKVDTKIKGNRIIGGGYDIFLQKRGWQDDVKGTVYKEGVMF